MKYIKIENYSCKNCNCKEYNVISFDPLIIACDKCGEVYNGEYTIEEVQEE